VDYLRGAAAFRLRGHRMLQFERFRDDLFDVWLHVCEALIVHVPATLSVRKLVVRLFGRDVEFAKDAKLFGVTHGGSPSYELSIDDNTYLCYLRITVKQNPLRRVYLMKTSSGHERIIKPATCTPEQIAEQIRARLVLESLENGSRVHTLTPTENYLIEGLSKAVVRILRRTVSKE
jgi:hypothetical protein